MEKPKQLEIKRKIIVKRKIKVLRIHNISQVNNIPSEFIDNGLLQEGKVTTARNDNIANLTMGNMGKEMEEGKIEVIETGDKGSAKITNNNENNQDTLVSPKQVNVDNTIQSKSIPAFGVNSTLGTDQVHREEVKVGNTPRVVNSQESNGGNNYLMEMDNNEREPSEIVPPIFSPGSHVFPSPVMKILAKSRRFKKKKKRMNNSHYQTKPLNNTGMWSAFPGRKIQLNKGSRSRGLSVNSGRSSRSKRKFRSGSKSSRSSRSGSYSKRYKKATGVKKMKRKYLKNFLPHVRGSTDREQIVKKFTHPS